VKKLLLGSFLFLLSFVVLSCAGVTTTTTTGEISTEDETTTQETTTETETTTEGESGTLYIHYYRFDGEYEDWSLWLWPHEPDSLAGAQYEFDNTDEYGVYAEIPIGSSDFADSTEIGVIVAMLPGWDAKDIDVDRYIDMTQTDEDGNIHVYLVQNTVEIYYERDQVDLGDRINFVQFTDETVIEFTATTTVTEADVQILKNDVPVTITDFTMVDQTGIIVIDEAVDLTNAYHLEINFGDNTDRSLVRFDGFYNSQAFNDAFYYEGDLGAIYEETQTTFRLWAPISESVTLNLYTYGHTADEVDYDGQVGVDNPYDSIEMTRIEKGVFEIVVAGDLNGVYYTYTVVNDGIAYEVVDPYAHSAGVNGERGMVLDFSSANPEGWVYGQRPDTMTNYTDAVIYEIHVRDYTSHESWNGTDEYRGKFLGLTERGTTYQGFKTGLDHILELGVTHVQFIPIFDHGIIDETRLNDESYYGIHDGIFNWGYMPENFNVVEGSYSTDPYHGEVRVNELKTMIQTFHDNDLRVIMDVVYNHTGKSADSNFDLILPGYYFRMNSDGSFSNGSGTGNETASERAMVRKYIVDSVLFWAEEYNMDGFRFDLMKLHDVETMNAVKEALHAIDPTIMIFGEPWTGGTSLLPEYKSAYKGTLDQMPGVGIFNDSTRDAIKGSVFNASETGFVQGHNGMDSRILYGVLGGNTPSQTINYVTAHDNNTLYDKLRLSAPDATMEEYIRMQRQAYAIILLSEGIPFLHGGVEIMRTKPCAPGGTTCDVDGLYDHNSYRSPDETNQIDWQWKVDHYETFQYYQTLIRLRQLKDVFRLPTIQEVTAQVTILEDGQSGLVAYLLEDPNDAWKTIYVIHNNGSSVKDYTLVSDTTWNLVLTTDEPGDWDGDLLLTMQTYNGGQTLTMAANETFIFYSTETIE